MVDVVPEETFHEPELGLVGCYLSIQLISTQADPLVCVLLRKVALYFNLKLNSTITTTAPSLSSVPLIRILPSIPNNRHVPISPSDSYGSSFPPCACTHNIRYPIRIHPTAYANPTFSAFCYKPLHHLLLLSLLLPISKLFRPHVLELVFS